MMLDGRLNDIEESWEQAVVRVNYSNFYIWNSLFFLLLIYVYAYYYKKVRPITN